MVTTITMGKITMGVGGGGGPGPEVHKLQGKLSTLTVLSIPAYHFINLYLFLSFFSSILAMVQNKVQNKLFYVTFKFCE